MTRHRSQAELETRLVECWDVFRGGLATVGEAFGRDELWETELEGHRLRLDPVLRRWLWFNGADRWWDDSGVGPGEAVILVLGGVVGARRLPLTGAGAPPIADWCVYRQGEKIGGPLPFGDLGAAVQHGEVDPAAVVWRTTEVRWRPVEQAASRVVPHDAPRYCGRCGMSLIDGARFCVRCGAPRARS